MKRRNSSLGNKLGLILVVLLMSAPVLAQKKPAKSKLESFLDTQFWLGLKLGTNLTEAYPGTQYSGFSPIDYRLEDIQKTYDNFSLPGMHMGLEMNFYHKGFSLSFQPAFKRSRYKYNSLLAWEGSETANRFETRYDVEQRLDMIELPLLLKYEIIQRGKIRPFVMVGGFYSFIASAQQNIDVTHIDYFSGSPLESSGGSSILGVKDSFQNFSGVSGGAGVNLDYWNIRTVLEVNYQYSLTSATRPNSQQNDLASMGEANDEIFLREVNISLMFIFPLRFIDQQFKSY